MDSGFYPSQFQIGQTGKTDPEAPIFEVPTNALATRWDPFFNDYMTLADVYRYPTQHFRFHEQQLSLGD